MTTILTPLLQTLGLAATDTAVTERFVSTNGDDDADGTRPSRPYATVGRALQDAGERHLRVNITPGTYQESLELPANVTLRGLGEGKAEIKGAGDAPTLRATGVRRVSLERLRITGGELEYTGWGGGGVVLDRVQDVRVIDCEVVDNLGLRGGGIQVTGCDRVTVRNCTISGNTAGNWWRTLAGCKVVPGVTIDYAPKGGQGGGIFISDSGGVEVSGCRITANHAIVFGGGIAVDNVGRADGTVVIRDNLIGCNQTAHGNVRPLAAPPSPCARDDIGDPVFDAFQSNSTIDPWHLRDLMNALHGGGREAGMGGGIALRRVTSATLVEGNRVGVDPAGEAMANVARRGGGIACFTGAYPTIRANTVRFNLASDDGGGLSFDQFDPFLPADQPSFMGIRRQERVLRQWISMDDNVVADNGAVSDGGGLYATGAVLLAIKSPTKKAEFSRNRAIQNGGGIRVSYAVRLWGEDLRFVENRANLIPVATEPAGGGGLATRNASVVLHRCSFERNVSNEFAGGAIYAVSAFEGGFGKTGFIGNQPGQFDRLMAAAGDLNFHERQLWLVDCKGESNQATGTRGAGGFLYAVRSPNRSDETGHPLGGEEPLWVTIDGKDTSLGVNRSDFNRAGDVRKRGNVVIELSGRVAGGIPQDRVFIAPEVPPAGIPPSSVGEAGTEPWDAIVLMPGEDRAHDRKPVRDPGEAVVWGLTPRLLGVTPVLAPTRGGISLVVRGERLEPGIRVWVGEKEQKFTLLLPDRILLEAPPLPEGYADITVQLSSGARAVLKDALRVMADPVIVLVTPSWGAPGTVVTVHGVALAGRPAVEVIAAGSDPDPARSVSYVSETELRVTMPYRPRGTRVGLRVRLDSGQQVAAENVFTYAY